MFKICFSRKKVEQILAQIEEKENYIIEHKEIIIDIAKTHENLYKKIPYEPQKEIEYFQKFIESIQINNSWKTKHQTEDILFNNQLVIDDINSEIKKCLESR